MFVKLGEYHGYGYRMTRAIHIPASSLMLTFLPYLHVLEEVHDVLKESSRL